MNPLMVSCEIATFFLLLSVLTDMEYFGSKCRQSKTALQDIKNFNQECFLIVF